jgi:hypothetical protein
MAPWPKRRGRYGELTFLTRVWPESHYKDQGALKERPSMLYAVAQMTRLRQMGYWVLRVRGEVV